MTKEQLESWLCGPEAPAPTSAEIAAVLGVPVEAIADTTLLRVADRRRALRFTLAVLRDVFTDDEDVRSWLRTPREELGGRSALELLRAGRLRAVEDLAVREWHRPAVAAPVDQLYVQVRARGAPARPPLARLAVGSRTPSGIAANS